MLRGPSVWPTAAERFFKENAGTVRSPKTRATWSDTLRLLHGRFGKRVEEYTEADLAAFLNEGIDKRTGRAWAGGTVNRHLTTLRSFFRWATHVELCTKDPTGYLGKMVNASSRPVREGHWLEAEDVAAILAGCEDGTLHGARDRAALALGFYAGLRVSEIGGLTWDKVRSNHLRIHGKGNKWAEVTLIPQLQEALTPWRTLVTSGIGGAPFNQPVLISFQISGGGCVPTERTWNPLWGRGIGTAGIAALLRARATAAGFDRIAPHDMRRTFAGMLQDEGAVVETIQGALRHDNVATTSRYLKQNPKRLHDALRGIRFGS